MKLRIPLLLLLGCMPMMAQQTKPQTAHERLLRSADTGASATVARRVCAIHPEASVWVYGNEWINLPCTRLAPILARNHSDLSVTYVQLEEAAQKTLDDIKKIGSPK